jgi:fatty acid-binding protein DegV
MSVVVVTDSTATLPAELAAERGIVVVPLQVIIGSHVHDEGSEGATPQVVAQALRDFVPVSTSRPAPARLAEVYERLAREGADEIVSVHLSGEMSGTFESSQLAARQVDVPVHCVDSRQVGVATGFAALSAVDAVQAGASGAEAAEVARVRAAAASSLFYVDTLGGALAVKPLLCIEDGKVANLERVRTAARALSRLEDLAVEAAGDAAAVDVCVAHLANPDRADALAARLAERLADRLEGREVWCAELGAVLGAHVGPGMLAVCVAPR